MGAPSSKMKEAVGGKVESMNARQHRRQRTIGSGRCGSCPSQSGYILLVLALFTAVIAIGLMRAIPGALVQTQREREEELIFRGEQYRRAVQNYVRKFGRYPGSLDDLEETNGVRFLRRRYRDPVTGEDEWRLIHIGPGGTFPDAKTARTLPTQPGGRSGGTGLAPSAASSEPRGFAPQPSQFEAAGSGFGRPATPPQTGPAIGAPGTTPDSEQDPQQLSDALRPSADPSANPAQQPRASGAAQQSGTVTFGEGSIAGVASQSADPSIKVYNGYLQYDEWEFIYNYQADQFGLAAVARATGGVAQPGLVQPGVAQPGAPGAPAPGVMSPRPRTPVQGVPFPSPFGNPAVAPRFPPSQFPGGPPGGQPGQSPFPGGQPGLTPFPGGQPGQLPFPGTQPSPQPASPFAPSPFPGQSGFSTTPGFGSQPPSTQPGQQFPPSPLPNFPSNPQQGR